MRIPSICAIVIIVTGIVLALIQLWFQAFSAGVFLKIMITLGLLLVGIVGTALIRREYVSEKQMKDDKFID